MEAWMVGGPVVTDLCYVDEEQDPDPEPHQSGKSDMDLHQSEKKDPDPHKGVADRHRNTAFLLPIMKQSNIPSQDTEIAHH
jgi:hypothetical protein